LQTARDVEGNHINTIEKYASMVRGWINEASL